MPVIATSEQCGSCKILKKELDKDGIKYEIKDLISDFAYFADNNIKVLPTLVISKDKKISGTAEILKYFKNLND